ncbi:MAG: hypothetical protein ABSH20_11155 [Tepidisphaeraceae bacterium]
MPVAVNAPRFDVTECRDQPERRFLERLSARATRGGWFADSWSHLSDHVIISIVIRRQGVVTRPLRADFFGSRLVLGDDETHQFVTELNAGLPGVTVVPTGAPEELAEIAADWLESQISTQV